MRRCNKGTGLLSVLWDHQNGRACAGQRPRSPPSRSRRRRGSVRALSAGSTDDTRPSAARCRNKLRRGCGCARQGARAPPRCAVAAPRRVQVLRSRAARGVARDRLGAGRAPDDGDARERRVRRCAPTRSSRSSRSSPSAARSSPTARCWRFRSCCSRCRPRVLRGGAVAKLPPAAAPTAERGVPRDRDALPLQVGGAAEFGRRLPAMLAQPRCWLALVAASRAPTAPPPARGRRALHRRARARARRPRRRRPCRRCRRHDDAVRPSGAPAPLLTGLCDALQPLNSAAVPPPNGADADGDDDDDDEAEGEAAEAQVALLSLAAGC